MAVGFSVFQGLPAPAHPLPHWRGAFSTRWSPACAGHLNTLEFNSACYYRYIALNLDLLADESHLRHFSDEELKAVVDAFIRASILSVSGARKNSMMGFNPPEYVLGTIREGQPVSLANAFENPVVGKGQGCFLFVVVALVRFIVDIREER